MKKGRKIIALIVGVLMLVALAMTLLVACGGGGPIEVGVSMPTKALQRWNQDGKYLRTEFKNAGYKTAVVYAGNESSKQIRQIESLITREAKILYISAIDATALNAVCEKAKAANIIVVGYDRIIEGTANIDYYFTFDNAQVGASCAQFIVDKLDLDNESVTGPFNLEIVGGDPTDANAGFVYDGGMAILNPYITSGKLVVPSGRIDFETIATARWDSAEAQKQFETTYAQNYTNKTLHAVFCSNDSTAQGVAAALTGKITAFPIITGQDCDVVSVKNMMEGKQSMSVFKDTRTLAKACFDLGIKVLKGEAIDIGTVTTNNGAKDVPTSISNVIVCTKNGEVVGEVDTFDVNYLVEIGYYTNKQLGIK